MMSKMAAPGNVRYAAPEDFCAIFDEDMNALYSLALLLTADHTMAEQCFLVALDDCLKGSDVFPGWARSWSRRAIVKQAIRQVNPRPDGAASASQALHDPEEIDDVPGRLLQLRPFERFVFAMSVLERYRVPECAALLNCDARDVERARMRALQLIGGTDRHLQPALFTSSSSHEPAPQLGA